MSAFPNLIAENLFKCYGSKTVVSDVSFCFCPGEILGLLGPNGAGKSTIVNMLYGRVLPSSGVVNLGPLRLPVDGRAFRNQIGVVTQEDNLETEFTVLENLLQFAKYYRMSAAVARGRAETVLRQLGLTAVANQTPEELSGGMQRRLILARALIHSPRFIFLDEPTTGLDPDARQDFWRLVLELRHAGCGVLLTTHYMEEARRLCDRLILLQQGEVVDEGPPDVLVERIVGREVFEIDSVDGAVLEVLEQKYRTWLRRFSDGYLLGVPVGAADQLWMEIQQIAGVRVTRRPGNLEDVFLLLTGQGLRSVE